MLPECHLQGPSGTLVITCDNDNNVVSHDPISHSPVLMNWCTSSSVRIANGAMLLQEAFECRTQHKNALESKQDPEVLSAVRLPIGQPKLTISMRRCGHVAGFAVGFADALRAHWAGYL